MSPGTKEIIYGILAMAAYCAECIAIFVYPWPVKIVATILFIPTILWMVTR